MTPDGRFAHAQTMNLAWLQSRNHLHWKICSAVLCWCRASTTCEGVLELARHQHDMAPEMQVYTANLGVLVLCWCRAGPTTGGSVNAVLVDMYV